MSSAALAGLTLGFVVAAQVGPIWLLCLRTSLRYGFAPGWAIGAGAALVDTLYAVAGVAGVAPLLRIEPVRIALGLLGAAVLAVLGLRTIWSAFRIRLGGETADEVASPRRAFATSVAATASNPMTIVSWAAIFSAASTADVVSSPSGALLLLVGVGIGSLAWFTHPLGCRLDHAAPRERAVRASGRRSLRGRDPRLRGAARLAHAPHLLSAASGSQFPPFFVVFERQNRRVPALRWNGCRPGAHPRTRD